MSSFLLESPSINLRDIKDATQASQSCIYFTEIPSSGLMLPEHNGTETAGTTPNECVSILTHWATWRQILLLQVSLPSLAFRWDCTEKEEEEGKKNVRCFLGCTDRRGGIKYVCFVLLFESSDCSGGESITLLVLSYLWTCYMRTQFSSACSAAWCGVGWLFCFPCSLNAVWLLFLLL